MNQPNYYQQQAPQPPRKNRTVLWIVIGVLIAGLFGTIAFYAVSFGKKMGEGFGKMAHMVKTMQDSLLNNTNENTYTELKNMLGNDSVSSRYRIKLDSLQQSTNRIISLFEQTRMKFEDTIKAIDASMSDRSVSRNYFIKTGRVQKLKTSLLDYRRSSILDMPESIRDSSLAGLLMIDQSNENTPALFKKLMSWENIYSQDPRQVIGNMNSEKIIIRLFESNLLTRYKREIRLSIPAEQANDSVQ